MDQDARHQVVELQKQVEFLTAALEEAQNEATNLKKWQFKKQVEEKVKIENQVNAQVAARLESFLQNLSGRVNETLLDLRAAAATSSQNTVPVPQQDSAGDGQAQKLDEGIPNIPPAISKSPALQSKISQGSNATLQKESDPRTLKQEPLTLSHSGMVGNLSEMSSAATHHHQSSVLRPQSPSFIPSRSGSPPHKILNSPAFIGPLHASIHAIPHQDPINPSNHARSGRSMYESDKPSGVHSKSLEPSRLVKSILPSPLAESSFRRDSSFSIVAESASTTPRSNRSTEGTVQGHSLSVGLGNDRGDENIIAPLAAIKETIRENKLTAPQVGMMVMNMVNLDPSSNYQNQSETQNQKAAVTAAITESLSRELSSLAPHQLPFRSTNSSSDVLGKVPITPRHSLSCSTPGKQITKSPFSDRGNHGPLIPVSEPKPVSKGQSVNTAAGPRPAPVFDPFSTLTHHPLQNFATLGDQKSPSAGKKKSLSSLSETSSDSQTLVHERNIAALQQFMSRHQAQTRSEQGKPDYLTENTIPTRFRSDYEGPTPSFTRVLGSQLDRESKEIVLKQPGAMRTPTMANVGSVDLPQHLMSLAWHNNGLTWVPSKDGKTWRVYL